MYVNKLDNLEERNQFLETYNLLRLNHKKYRKSEQTSNGKRDWISNKISPTKKSPGPDDFSAEIYQILKKTPWYQFFWSSSKNIEEKGVCPNSFCGTSITLISRPGKDDTRKEKSQVNIFDEHRCKNPQHNISKLNSIRL